MGWLLCCGVIKMEAHLNAHLERYFLAFFVDISKLYFATSSEFMFKSRKFNAFTLDRRRHRHRLDFSCPCGHKPSC